MYLRRQSELKTFQPWVTEVEERIKGGQKKPTSLAEAQEMLKSVQVSVIVIRHMAQISISKYCCCFQNISYVTGMPDVRIINVLQL